LRVFFDSPGIKDIAEVIDMYRFKQDNNSVSGKEHSGSKMIKGRTLMANISFDNCIRCCFDLSQDENLKEGTIPIEIFFAETKDLISEYKELKKFFDKNDVLRAERFYFKEDHDTWLFCHTLLRLFISSKLGIEPSEVIITYDKNNKPWLKGDALFFNISHTRDAFAFAISERGRIGVDLERIDRDIDFISIIKKFFSRGEVKFILEDTAGSKEKFFLLWTRKEALLKALGTGIIEKLTDVEVFREENFLNRASFENIIDESVLCEHFIYSDKVLNNYLSVAVPSRAIINFHFINYQNIGYYLRSLSK
jgi:phosphopantetheine--protein transferase-like protein